MEEANKLSEVEVIKVHSTLGLFYKNILGDLYSFDKSKLIAQKVYNFSFADNGVVYTQSELGDLFIAMNDNLKVLPGFFYLDFFKRLSQYYAVVKNDSPEGLTNKVILIDKLFENQKPFKSFRAAIDGYFATGKRNEIIVFDENLEELWKKELTEVDNALSNNEKLPRTFDITDNQALIIPLESGQLLALDISTGELKWKQERVGRMAIYENRIYCIADYTIKELDANTGEILRKESMQDLIETYGFKPTGSHKVYDEYVFAMTSGKPGMVAIYDRRTLKFQEVIKLDEMIPFGTDHLHWHNNKLYVLDFGKTLHIYEEE